MPRKTCLVEDCDRPRWGKGYCDRHQSLRTDKKPKPRKKTGGLTFSTRKPIKPISDKRKEQMVEYHKVRLKYLNQNKNCEYEGCKNKATEIHHMRERHGDRLTDSEYFMAICRTCHQTIHANPKESRDKGYLI